MVVPFARAKKLAKAITSQQLVLSWPRNGIRQRTGSLRLQNLPFGQVKEYGGSALLQDMSGQRRLRTDPKDKVGVPNAEKVGSARQNID